MTPTPLLALRRLARTPASALTALVTLTLAFAANVAIFSVVDGVLLRELPFVEPERLLHFHNHPEGRPEVTFEISYPELLAVRQGVEALDGVAGHASSSGGLTVRVGDSLQQLPGAIVSGNLFSVLGVEPLAGRSWTEDDDVPGAEPVAAVGERLWRRAWGGDPALLGSTIEVGGVRHRVTAILPASFEYPAGAELWVPVHATLPAELLESPQTRFFNPVARLAPGANAAAAVASWNAAVDETTDLRLPASARSEVTAAPIAGELLGAGRSTLLFLWGAAALVLAIACANVVNLQVVRALGRRYDTALRRALGACWSDLVRLSLWESGLVTLAACALGSMLGAAAVRAVLHLSPVALYRGGAVEVDGRVWLFALALAAATALVTGLAPLAAAVDRRLAATLQDGGARSVGHGGARRALRGFVVAQTALAVVLVLGAALLTRSFLLLSAEDPGFDRSRVVSFGLVQSGPADTDPAEHDRMIDELVERLRERPAVEDAAGVLLRPLDSLAGFDAAFTLEGRPPEESAGYPHLNFEAVTPGYFETLGIPLLEGRPLDAADREGAPPVVLVSRAVAERFFGGGSPVGRRLKWGGPDAAGPWIEIVGVVGDGRYRRLDEVSLNIFVPHRQTAWPLNHLVVRGKDGDLDALGVEIRAAVRSSAFGVEAADLLPLDGVLRRSLSAPRFQSLLLGIFALLALLLGAVGLYGVISYLLSTRRQEMGVRLALGARPADLVRLVLGEAVGLAALGLGAGLALGFGLARLLAGYLGVTLYGIAAGEPASLAATVGGLMLAALAAGLPPALRAARTDPVVALRAR